MASHTSPHAEGILPWSRLRRITHTAAAPLGCIGHTRAEVGADHQAGKINPELNDRLREFGTDPYYSSLQTQTCPPTTGDHPQKKSLIASERDAWSRAQFAVAQQDIDPADLVVIDEFGSNLNMTPQYGWAPKGERVIATVPRNTPENTTTISSITLQGMGPSMVIAGSVTTAVFEAYLKHVLIPRLRPGQMVVLDI
ncbi:MAG: hypothetical protein Fur005_10480 [Roseiflexaceae bacterium]